MIESCHHSTGNKIKCKLKKKQKQSSLGVLWRVVLKIVAKHIRKHLRQSLLLVKPKVVGLQLWTYFFYKQLLCKQLAFRWQMAKQLSGLNSLSLSNTKNYRLKRKLEFSLKRKITIKPTIHQNSTVSKALLRKF